MTRRDNGEARARRMAEDPHPCVVYWVLAVLLAILALEGIAAVLWVWGVI